MTSWGLASAMRAGVRDLFPTRKAKTAMWGVVGLGVVITYMELGAAQFFSILITGIEDESATRTILIFGGFLLTFAAIRGISYFQSVYRLTVFGKAFRQINTSTGAAESWRWPMAIALVGMMGQLSRLIAITVAVVAVAWMYGLLLIGCSLIAVLIVNRAGHNQYEIHHQFAQAKMAGNPPSAAERIGTRIRAGERAGLVAMGPILVYVAALGAGAATGRVSTQSALVLFISGRMASNMYGSLANASMRYIRAQVNVEAYGGASSKSSELGEGTGSGFGVTDEHVYQKISSGGYIWEPPAQAFAHLVDDGHIVGDATTIGRVAREAGFGPNRALRKQAPPPGPDKFVATAPNQVWLHGAFMVPIGESESPNCLQVVVDAFSRTVVGWRLGSEASYGDVSGVFHETCDLEGIEPDQVNLSTSGAVFGITPNLHDFLRSLGVVRTLLWTAPVPEEAPPRPDRPEFPALFVTRAEADRWISKFVAWYNTVFYQPDIGYLHPSDVHSGLADVVTAQRQGTLEAALAAGDTRFPARIPETWLPPEKAWVDQASITTIAREVQGGGSQALDEDEEL